MVFIVFTVSCGIWAHQRQTWLNTRHRARKLMEPLHSIAASVHWERLSHLLRVSFCQVLSGGELFNTLHLSLLYPQAGCRIAALLIQPGSVPFALAAWFCTGYYDILRKTLVHSSSRKSLAWIGELLHLLPQEGDRSLFCHVSLEMVIRLGNWVGVVCTPNPVAPWEQPLLTLPLLGTARVSNNLHYTGCFTHNSKLELQTKN